MSQNVANVLSVLLVCAMVAACVAVLFVVGAVLHIEHSKDHACLWAGYQGYAEVNGVNYCWRYRGGSDLLLRPMDKIKGEE